MAKAKLIYIIIFVISVPNFCWGQAEGKRPIFNSSAVVNTKPILYNDISFNSGELLAANFSYANKDNTQKIVLKPFGFTTWDTASWKNTNFWKDTKLNLTQKEGITTMGLALSFDNASSYNEKRIDKILSKNKLQAFACPVGTEKDKCAKLKEEYVKDILNPWVIEIMRERVK